MAIPAPEPGLVIEYAYLWHDDHAAGSAEGRKNRPSVIVLVKAGAPGGAIVVTVQLITHSPPSDPRLAVEIPPRAPRLFSQIQEAFVACHRAGIGKTVPRD